MTAPPAQRPDAEVFRCHTRFAWPSGQSGQRETIEDSAPPEVGHEGFRSQRPKPSEEKLRCSTVRCALGFKPSVGDCRTEDRSESITGWRRGQAARRVDYAADRAMHADRELFPIRAALHVEALDGLPADLCCYLEILIQVQDR